MFCIYCPGTTTICLFCPTHLCVFLSFSFFLFFKNKRGMSSEEGDSHETRVLKAQALEALKKMNRNRLALAAQKEETDTGVIQQRF
jgi:hypothetical protein